LNTRQQKTAIAGSKLGLDLATAVYLLRAQLPVYIQLSK